MRIAVDNIRNRVLDLAKLTEGHVLLDVGAGDGLIAFGAFERVGPTLSAIFCDISAPLLEHAEQRAIKLGLRDCCSFVKTGAEDLEGIADEVADVVTCRAVLVYVTDKVKALRQIYRALKPGGRIAICDPINQDEAIELTALTRWLEKQPVGPITEAARLVQRWRAAQVPSTKEAILSNPTTNFTERDLMKFVGQAGFQDIHMEFHIDTRPLGIRSWETFLNVAPRPNVPSLGEILGAEFTLEERGKLEEALRRLFESNAFFERDAVAYLTAVKPK
ncbi:MAG TPA: methyltransferase domain-containing protein [Acidobacteriaceae bacterium]